MFFDSRHHSPKEFIRIRNFKKIIFSAEIGSCEARMRVKIFTLSHFWVYQIIPQNIFRYYTVVMACAILKTKNKSNKASNLARTSISGSIKLVQDPNFHFESILRYDRIVLKNIFCYYPVAYACPILHTKNQTPKALSLFANYILV